MAEWKIQSELLSVSISMFVKQIVRGIELKNAKWRAPNPGWIKVNMDGATNRNGNWSAVGGVLRDSSRNWVEGFRKFVGRGSTVNSKLWTILRDLEIARLRGYNKIIIKTDCMMAIDMNKDCLENTPLMSLVRKIKEVSR